MNVKQRFVKILQSTEKAPFKDTIKTLYAKQTLTHGRGLLRDYESSCGPLFQALIFMVYGVTCNI